MKAREVKFFILQISQKFNNFYLNIE